MTLTSPASTITFYRRDDCALCDEARTALQDVLEQRALRGDPGARVRVVNVACDSELEAVYGARVPVLVVGEQELALTTSARAIGAFLDRVLGRLA